jgi:hypothetical protein
LKDFNLDSAVEPHAKAQQRQFNLETAVDEPQRAQRTQGIELGKGKGFTRQVIAPV